MVLEGFILETLLIHFNCNQKFASLKTDLDNLRGKLAQKLAQERLEQQEKNDAAFEKFGNATSNVGRGVS